ncbi:hypothetical protein AMTRI_Chr12g268830 [Amborella trichopoda]
MLSARLFRFPSQHFLPRKMPGPSCRPLLVSACSPVEPKPKPWLLVGLGNPGKKYEGTRHSGAEIYSLPGKVDRFNEHHDLASELPHQGSQFKNRVTFGLGMGALMGGIVLSGGWVFTLTFSAAVFVGAREYFELVRSQGMTAGITPPPRYVSRICSVVCALMPIMTMFGRMGPSVTSFAFVVAIALILQRGNPRFAQLSSAIFGLFYCGYLPCFWVKLRCGLAVPALYTKIGAAWPILLGGQAHWTVGLVATLISISGVIAADTCAYLGGKMFGRTPLTNISPKKTLEGAFAGLSGCVATTIILSRILCWPTSLLRHSLLHCCCTGGLLDRVDSYIFTGALVYSFVKTGLPLFGV